MATGSMSNRERVVSVANGWPMLTLFLALLLGDTGLFIYSIAAGVAVNGQPIVWLLLASMFLLPVIIVLMTGLFTLQPNEARVLVLFGEYKGTVRTSGFHWGNPFYSGGQQAARA